MVEKSIEGEEREKFESHHNSATAGIVPAVPQLFLTVAPITAEDVSPLSTAARGIRDTLLLFIGPLMLILVGMLLNIAG